MKKHAFRLRFPERDIPTWAARFPDVGTDDDLLDRIRPLVLVRGHLTRPEFLKICARKSVRTKPRCRNNSAHRIETLTRAALATSDEALKIDLLRLLDGVEWPTASTILHFCDARPYPILDYRALWSLGYAKPPKYTMEFWLAYLNFTRDLASRLAPPDPYRGQGVVAVLEGDAGVSSPVTWTTPVCTPGLARASVET